MNMKSEYEYEKENHHEFNAKNVRKSMNMKKKTTTKVNMNMKKENHHEFR